MLTSACGSAMSFEASITSDRAQNFRRAAVLGRRLTPPIDSHHQTMNAIKSSIASLRRVDYMHAAVITAIPLGCTHVPTGW